MVFAESTVSGATAGQSLRNPILPFYGLFMLHHVNEVGVGLNTMENGGYASDGRNWGGDVAFAGG